MGSLLYFRIHEKVNVVKIVIMYAMVCCTLFGSSFLSTQAWTNILSVKLHIYTMGSIQLFLKIELELLKFNPQINLPFNFLNQKYVFHDNHTWTINYSE